MSFQVTYALQRLLFTMHADSRSIFSTNPWPPAVARDAKRKLLLRRLLSVLAVILHLQA